VITIGVTGNGTIVTVPGGYVLVADNVDQWHEHWQGIEIKGKPVMPVSVDVAALTPSYPIAEWGKGRMPIDAARDSLARARDAAAIVLHELQRELGDHPDADGSPADQ
jgi:hypothetical protein